MWVDVAACGQVRVVAPHRRRSHKDFRRRADKRCRFRVNRVGVRDAAPRRRANPVRLGSASQAMSTPGRDLSRRVNGKTRARPTVPGTVQPELELAANMIRHMNVPTFVLDAQGKVLVWNLACERLTGVSAKAVLGTSDHWQAFYDTQRPCLADLVARDGLDEIKSLYTVNASAHGDSSGYYAENWCVMPKLGTRLYLEIHASAIRDARGRLLAVVETLRDSTAARRSEEALHEAQKNLQERLALINEANQKLATEVDAHRRTEEAMVVHQRTLEGTVRRMESYQREDQVLLEMTELLQACVTRDEAYSAIRETTARLFPGVAGTLNIYRESRDVLEHVATLGAESGRGMSFAPDECWALRLGRPHRVAAASAVRCRHVHANGVSYVCMPIHGEGQILGLLHMQVPLRDDGTWHDDGSERRMRALTDRVGPSVANLRLRDSLRELALHDSLTGLYNRRYMEDALARETRRVERTGRPLSLLMVDVDHFKRFNDTYGHDAGDFVLASIARLLRKHMRSTDIVCRYGGEELAVLMPEASVEAARERAEELRAFLSGENFSHRGQLLPSPTASFGVAEYPRHGSSVDAFVKAADSALYRAKQDGRDRVRCAEDGQGSQVVAGPEDRQVRTP